MVWWYKTFKYWRPRSNHCTLSTGNLDVPVLVVLYPRRDCVLSIATIHTSSIVITRPAVRLCPLPSCCSTSKMGGDVVTKHISEHCDKLMSTMTCEFLLIHPLLFSITLYLLLLSYCYIYSLCFRFFVCITIGRSFAAYYYHYVLIFLFNFRGQRTNIVHLPSLSQWSSYALSCLSAHSFSCFILWCQFNWYGVIKLLLFLDIIEWSFGIQWSRSNFTL